MDKEVNVQPVINVDSNKAAEERLKAYSQKLKEMFADNREGGRRA